jgi:hypothetical protein
MIHTEQEQYEYMVSRGMRKKSAKVYSRMNVLQGIDCIPGCIVTYADPNRETVSDPGASIAKFYEECRAKYPNLNQVFVGD